MDNLDDNLEDMRYVLVLTVLGDLADDSIEAVSSMLNGMIIGNGSVEDNAFVQRYFSVRPLSEVVSC